MSARRGLRGGIRLLGPPLVSVFPDEGVWYSGEDRRGMVGILAICPGRIVAVVRYPSRFGIPSEKGGFPYRQTLAAG